MNSMWLLILFTFLGIALGYALPFNKRLNKIINVLQIISLYAILTLMGLKLGLDETLFSYLAVVGVQSLVLAVAAMAGSVIVTILIQSIVLRSVRVDIYEEDVEKNHDASYKTTVMVIALLIIGIIVGVSVDAAQALVPYIDNLVMGTLMAMVFLAGLDIGKSKDVFASLKRSSMGIFIVVSGILIGSTITSALIAPLIGVKMLEGAAVGSAAGWYSLSGIAYSQVSVKLGAMAFLANVMRECFSFIVIPIIAKKFGPFVAVSPAGCTAMDSTLPIITQSTSSANAIVAFGSGVVLSVLIPFIINIFIGIL